MQENERKFDHRIKNPEPQIVEFLTAIDEARGVFRVGVRMTPQAITNLKKSVLITPLYIFKFVLLSFKRQTI